MEVSKQKKSQRPYRRYTVSIGDILHDKANAGDEKARTAFEKMVRRPANRRKGKKEVRI